MSCAASQSNLLCSPSLSTSPLLHDLFIYAKHWGGIGQWDAPVPLGPQTTSLPPALPFEVTLAEVIYSGRKEIVKQRLGSHQPESVFPPRSQRALYRMVQMGYRVPHTALSQ